MKRAVLSLLVVGFLGVAAHADTYMIDPYHSSVSFKVKHVVGKVTGKFDKFTGSFDYDAAHLDKASAEATIDATSVDTGIDKRDNHLRSSDFFDVTKFPTLTFKSTGVTDMQGAVAGSAGQGTVAKLHGDLTMHGVTKPVVLDLVIEGVAKGMQNKMVAGATATGHLNRQDFGIGPSSGPMAGMVGSDIEITIEIEGTQKK